MTRILKGCLLGLALIACESPTEPGQFIGQWTYQGPASYFARVDLDVTRTLADDGSEVIGGTAVAHLRCAPGQSQFISRTSLAGWPCQLQGYVILGSGSVEGGQLTLKLSFDGAPVGSGFTGVLDGDEMVATMEVSANTEKISDSGLVFRRP